MLRYEKILNAYQFGGVCCIIALAGSAKQSVYFRCNKVVLKNFTSNITFESLFIYGFMIKRKLNERLENSIPSKIKIRVELCIPSLCLFDDDAIANRCIFNYNFNLRLAASEQIKK